MTPYKVLLACLFCIIASICHSQQLKNCSSVEYDQLLRKKHNLPSQEEFEKWVQNKITNKRIQQSQSRLEEVTYTIPMVIHIIHNGEGIGSGTNISQDQIDSQVKIINDDYRRRNADSIKTPSLFKGVAADVNIEFKLAKQDPDGAPTSGIVRVNGYRDAWAFGEGQEMKKLSYWPSDKYLNIWVVNLSDQTIGYSQFPTSNILPGLEEGSDIKETDGVVISYRYFGRSPVTSKNSRGRTLTHEVGHFLGLKHTWGDDDNACTGDDYVADTPNQAGPHNICPGFPNSSCGNTSDMFMNYLDYSPDTCMNIFTLGQKERMRIILENSPSRLILLSSKVLQEPTPRLHDAAITKIYSPDPYVCSNLIEPAFFLRNLGTSTLTNITISYSLNNNTPVYLTKTFSLRSYDTARFVLPQITLPGGPGYYNLKLQVQDPNGAADENTVNDTLSIKIYYAPTATLPFKEDFSGSNTFSVRNPDNLKTWAIVNAPGNGANNKAAFMDLYSNQKTVDDKDYLVSPFFNTNSLDSLGLSFKYAYARKDGNSSDVLSIRVSTDCGATFNSANEIYYASYDALSTSAITNSPFVPSSPSQWKDTCINLQQFIGIQHLQIAFIATSGRGNNLYLDDIELKYTTCNKNTPVAIDQATNNELKVNVFPNPNDGKFNVDINLPTIDDVTLSVYDVLGKSLYTDSFRKIRSLQQQISLPSPSAGVHFIVIQAKKVNVVRKIIVK